MKKIKLFLSFILCLCFTQAQGQTPGQLKLWLPAVEGWSVNETTEVFNPDNLFDRINGAAPLFIENNFREMTSLEYKKGEDYITIQAYRHATPEDAFGMYASERTPEMTFYPIGGEGQGDENSFFFFAGNMYVKMWVQAPGNGGETLRAIAKGFAEKIDPHAGYPALFENFPQEGKVPHSEGYITSNYIGHTFLNKVYYAVYTSDNKSFQLFLIDGGTEEGAKEILGKYLSFTRQDAVPKEGVILLKDRYNGDIPLLVKGKNIWGIFSENGDSADFALFLNN